MNVRLAGNRLMALAVIAASSGCAAKVDSAEGPRPPAQTVNVQVTPASAALVAGQAMQFAVGVTGTANTAVTWQVDEAGGGTIDESGLFTAPGDAGTFHVRAVSRADASAWGRATVTVTAPPDGTVTISPKTISISTGGTTTFTAVATNLSSNAISWRVQESSGCGSVSSAGVYTAPSSATTCHVVATSVADTTKSDVATVTVTAPSVVRVSVSPASLTMDACTSQVFTASVSGTSDQRVVWSVTEGAAGGVVTAAGAYTAPPNAGTYRVVAAAVASPAATATATVTVNDHVLSVTVDPPRNDVPAGGTQQFTATVTTTCGSFAAR
jgi:hypothetical protein